jgi:hypothetical protein
MIQYNRARMKKKKIENIHVKFVQVHMTFECQTICFENIQQIKMRVSTYVIKFPNYQTQSTHK